jgi:hypothetical protein
MQVKTEGTVNLSISELDNLRTQIVELTKERDSLLSTQGKVFVQVTVTDKYASVDYRDNTYYDHIEKRYKGHYESFIKPNYKEIGKTETYVNLEEVQKHIYEDAKSKVIEEMGALQREVNDLKRNIEKLKTDNYETQSKLKSTYEEEIQKIEKTKEEELRVLQNKIAELEGKEVDRTKDEIIEKLNKELATNKQEIEKLKLKKSFWGFLH